VPLTICSSRFVSWRGWDSKKLPLPFNRINLVIHDAILVNRENFDEAGARLVSALKGQSEAH
jgi:lysophospholipid acyltransferase (LPLAT)-like uncharacterized protein